MSVNNPPAYADIRLLVGEQRSGKSTTMVALPTEDYYKKMTALTKINEKGQSISQIKAQCLTESDRKMLWDAGLLNNQYINYSLVYCRITAEDGRSTIVRIPYENNFIVESPVHIFANFPLYGIRYANISIVDIIQFINTDMFDNGWILSDESVMNDPRNSMTAMGKLMATFGATIGKRNAKLLLATQLNEMMERRFRAFATTTIVCSYDEITKMINFSIKKRGEDEVETDYYEPQYRRFFKSGEKILVPQNIIDNALAKFNKASV